MKRIPDSNEFLDHDGALVDSIPYSPFPIPGSQP